MTDQKETSTENITKVAVKLLDYWTEDPDCGSFMQRLPSEMLKSHSRKPNSTTSSISSPEIMVSVRGLIMGYAASSETPYKDLKAKLVSSYTLSRWQKVSKLIHHPGLVDRRPTALMDSMLALLPEGRRENRLPVPGFFSGEITH